MTQRRTHTSLAVAELQNVQSYMADVADVGGFVEVPALKEGDVLTLVKAHKAGNPPTLHTDTCTIVEPRSFADLDADAANPSGGEWVTVGPYKFEFTTDSVLLYQDNYPVGSNRSYRMVYVEVGASELESMQNLEAAINRVFAKDPNGVTASIVDTDNVRVSAKKPGPVEVAVSHDGGFFQDWVNGAAESPNPNVTKVDPVAVAGFVTTDDLITGVDSDGIEVQWRTGDNEAPQDVGAKLVGTYSGGDPAYDTEDPDPAVDGNVGYGVGRMPPGWQP